MLDKQLAIAFSVQAKKGVYALLLGSGISRAAGILTGWEILKDLILRLARANEDQVPSDPIAWYQHEYGEAPNYSVLLKRLGNTKEHRNHILRPYFTPGADSAKGEKEPTKAHRSIARLVKAGFIKVIVTTNFDRLLEQALQYEGVEPVVVASPSAAQGATPLVHSECTLLKVNGDYLDPSIRNTPEELAKYERPIDNLLKRVFDDYGLIVCGWSGEWDPALRSALDRSPSRRFATYWATRSDPVEAVRGFLKRRGAETVRIEDADSFFGSLEENVSALDSVSRVHPTALAVAVETVKRYVVDSTHRVRKFDLLQELREEARARLKHTDASLSQRPRTGESIMNVIEEYWADVETLVAVVLAGAYFDRSEDASFWSDNVRRIAEARDRPSLVFWQSIHHFPAHVLHYSVGVAAIASGNYSLLKSLLEIEILDWKSDSKPLMNWTHPGHYSQDQQWGYHRIGECLWSVASSIERNRERFSEALRRFEYLQAMHVLHVASVRHIPHGSFAWEERIDEQAPTAVAIEKELGQLGKAWPPLAEGLYGGNISTARQIQKDLEEHLRKREWRQM